MWVKCVKQIWLHLYPKYLYFCLKYLCWNDIAVQISFRLKCYVMNRLIVFFQVTANGFEKYTENYGVSRVFVELQIWCGRFFLMVCFGEAQIILNNWIIVAWRIIMLRKKRILSVLGILDKFLARTH